ncbi:MAG: XdhC family protein [Burkholderiaceae bacterium]|nr:XdhC family protein [Burkholderiaceae bacterium]
MNPAHDVLAAAQRLRTEQRPFALVTVLRVAPPASARPGDKAVATADGIGHGWIGGGCAQPAVTKTVRAALADGRARMIRIAPADEGSVRELDEVLEFGMACHSGGTLELFVDPVLPDARLVVIGDTPLAAALAGLAPRVGLPVVVVAHGGDAARYPDAQRVVTDDGATAEVPAGAFVVIATQGRRDLQGLRVALAVGARRVFFVASARKAAVLKASLVESGGDPAAVAAIVAPAGQPIGAQTPEEIALSVLAAVIAARRERAGDGPAATRTALVSAGTPVADISAESSATDVSAETRAADAPAGTRAADSLAEAPSSPSPSACCGGSTAEAVATEAVATGGIVIARRRPTTAVAASAAVAASVADPSGLARQGAASGPSPAPAAPRSCCGG